MHYFKQWITPPEHRSLPPRRLVLFVRFNQLCLTNWHATSPAQWSTDATYPCWKQSLENHSLRWTKLSEWENDNKGKLENYKQITQKNERVYSTRWAPHPPCVDAPWTSGKMRQTAALVKTSSSSRWISTTKYKFAFVIGGDACENSAIEASLPVLKVR